MNLHNLKILLSCRAGETTVVGQLARSVGSVGSVDDVDARGTPSYHIIVISTTKATLASLTRGLRLPGHLDSVDMITFSSFGHCIRPAVSQQGPA